MTKDLTTAKRKRTTKKNIVLNRVIPQCEEILSGEMNEDVIAEAVVMMKTLEEAADEVRCLDGEVSDLLLEDEEQYEQNEKEAYDFLVKTRRVAGRLAAFLDKKTPIPTIASNPMSRQTQGVKLPKIEISKFGGDAIRWKSFIDIFDATVHARNDISDIQ